SRAARQRARWPRRASTVVSASSEETTPPARRPTRKPGSGWTSTSRKIRGNNLELIPGRAGPASREGLVMSPRWFLVAVLATPMLISLTSEVSARPEAQEPKAGQQEGGPARADLFVAPTGRDDNPGTAAKPPA